MELDRTRLAQLRARKPLIHCIVNDVSANDCANLALAVGASPIMARAPEEMEEITAHSAATVLNTGTPEQARFALCCQCGTMARSAGQPVVLDPVGVGASAWRLRETEKLLSAFTPSILRVNDSEALALLYGAGGERGVDSDTSRPEAERRQTADALARKRSAVVLLSGAEDIVSDGERSLRIPGGSSLMSSVTGSGCMLSVLCGVFAAVEPDAFQAAALASVFWKRCAAAAEQSSAGLGSFRIALLDAAGRFCAVQSYICKRFGNGWNGKEATGYDGKRAGCTFD